MSLEQRSRVQCVSGAAQKSAVCEWEQHSRVQCVSGAAQQSAVCEWSSTAECSA